MGGDQPALANQSCLTPLIGDGARVRSEASRAALLSRNEVVGFRLQAGHFLATAPKSNQKAPPLASAPDHRRRRSAMARYPALLACGGVRIQAIPGLYADASASMPRPARTHARANIRSVFAVLGAADGEGTLWFPHKFFGEALFNQQVGA